VEIANQKAWGQIRAKKVREGSNFQVVDGRTRIGGVWPRGLTPIPTIRAEFPRFTSKSVHISTQFTSWTKKSGKLGEYSDKSDSIIGH
jgi:hypothetical protein